MATYTSGNAWNNGGTFSTPGTIFSMSSMRFAGYDHQWNILSAVDGALRTEPLGGRGSDALGKDPR